MRTKLLNIKNKLASKKGQLGLNSVVGISFTIILIAITALILTNVQADAAIVSLSVADNAITDGLSMIGNTTGQLPLVGTMIGLSLVVVAALFLFARKGKGSGGLGV